MEYNILNRKYLEGCGVIVPKQVFLRLTLNYSDEVSDDEWEMVKEMLEQELRLNWQRGHLDLGRNELESVKLSVTHRVLEKK